MIQLKEVGLEETLTGDIGPGGEKIDLVLLDSECDCSLKELVSRDMCCGSIAGRLQFGPMWHFQH